MARRPGSRGRNDSVVQVRVNRPGRPGGTRPETPDERAARLNAPGARIIDRREGLPVFESLNAAFTREEVSRGASRRPISRSVLGSNPDTPGVGQEFFVGDQRFLRTAEGFAGLSPRERAGFVTPTDSFNLFGVQDADVLRSQAGAPRGRRGIGRRRLLFGGEVGVQRGTAPALRRALAASQGQNGQLSEPSTLG